MPHQETQADVLFGQMALEQRIVDRAQLDEGRQLVGRSAEPTRLADALVQLGHMTREQSEEITLAVGRSGGALNPSPSGTPSHSGRRSRPQRAAVWGGLAAAIAIVGLLLWAFVLSDDPKAGGLSATSPAAPASDLDTAPEDLLPLAARDPADERPPVAEESTGIPVEPELENTTPPPTLQNCSLSIHVNDAEAQPIAGLRVHLNFRGRTIGVFSTDDAGAALAEPIPPGRYSFRIEGPGFDEVVSAADVLLRPDDNKEVFVEIGRANRSIAGRILDANGDPVSGLLIRARRHASSESEGVVTLANAERLSVRSGEEGEFVITGLEQGEYLLSTEETNEFLAVEKVFLAGIQTADISVGLQRLIEAFGVVTDVAGVPLSGVSVRTGEGQVRTADDGRFSVRFKLTDEVSKYPVSANRSGYRPFHLFLDRDEIADEERVEVEIVLESLGETTVVEGVLLDTSGAPVPGVRVYMNSRSMGSVHSAVSDEKGEFVIEKLPLGNDYRAYVQPEYGYKDAMVQPLTVSKSTPPVELVLEPLLAGGSVRGTMVDASGNPIPNFTLRLRHQSAARSRFEIVGDDAGTFAADGIPAGPLVFETTSSAQSRIRIQGATLEPDAELEVVLVLDWGSHSVTGSVVDDSGAPVAGADVRMAWSHSSQGLRSVALRSAKSDGQGRFQFSALGTGVHQLTALASGARSVAINYEVGSNKPDPVLTVRAPAGK